MDGLRDVGAGHAQDDEKSGAKGAGGAKGAAGAPGAAGARNPVPAATPTAAEAKAPVKHAGGRRPGETRTRTAILDAARSCFAESGFEGTSMRRVAETAGVDQALVHHFYGSKRNLFIQVLELPEKLAAALSAATRGEAEGLGERIVRAHLSVWDDVSARPALMAMVRSAATQGDAGARLRDTLSTMLGQALDQAVAGPDTALRTNLIASQLIGLGLMRYILLLEPLASADTDTVARYYGTAVQAIVEGGTAGGPVPLPVP
ncbi:TetR family transcriptional regulator [Streptomyces sp. NPDC049954]|uniref:TetR/AcrR family transcriptional regulator n=1 Tax=Streptomyces sp. NPDC049954 TaxID=3155779 RepID=UPI003444EC17